MPRANKAVRRQKINAGLAWKRGNREEALKIWKKADEDRKTLQAKKKKAGQAPPKSEESSAE